MSQATVELDFFGMEKEASHKSQFQKFLDRGRSFRGIQGAISKINPEIIKSVIGSGTVNQSYENGNLFESSKESFSVPSTPRKEQREFPVLPVYAPISRPSTEKVPETAPLTIFYNGKVVVFHVPKDTAESILKIAVDSTDSKAAIVPPSDQRQLLETFNGDLPIQRKKSLQRFLEKRKERLTSVSPYGCYIST